MIFPLLFFIMCGKTALVQKNADFKLISILSLKDFSSVSINSITFEPPALLMSRSTLLCLSIIFVKEELISLVFVTSVFKKIDSPSIFLIIFWVYLP